MFSLYILSISNIGTFVAMPGLLIAASLRNVRLSCLRLRLTAYDLTPEED